MNGAGMSMPWLEACLDTGTPARFSAGGLQSFSHEEPGGEGPRVAGFGRLRFREPELAGLARIRGEGAALLAAWRRHGEALPGQISGEHAALLWDPRERRGVALVDRFGSLPLYWGRRGSRVALASRPARVCALLGLPVELDPAALHAYAHFHVIPAPLSIHRSVSRLDIGQMLVIERGSARVLTHWQPSFQEEEPFDFVRERQAFLSALREGVAECTADVPRGRLGCFLSGGTDSSTIAGLACEVRGEPVKTFAIGFDVSAYDERRYSRLAAAHFGTDHTEHVLSVAETEAAIDRLARASEQPFGNASAVPTLVCAQIARQAGVMRLLGGDGGDELYGGNERYATQWLFSLYERLPAGARRHLLEPLLFGPLGLMQAWPVRKARSYVEQARLPLPDRLGARYNLLNLFGADAVLGDLVLAAGFQPLTLEREVWSRSQAGTQLNRLLAYDFKFTLGDNDLPKVTRMCHAAGVEVAFPMLTESVAAHSLRLAPGEKLKRRQLRHFFRQALRGFLPDEILDKPKHGFGMPFGEWLLGQPRLSERAIDALLGLEDRGVLRAGFGHEVHRAVRLGHAGYYGTLVWVMMTLELWLRAQAGTEGMVTRPAPEPALG